MNWQCKEAFVALGSIAPEPLINFYTQLLGQQPNPYQPGVYAEFNLPKLRLAIFLPKPDHQLEFGQLSTGDKPEFGQLSAGDKTEDQVGRNTSSEMENNLSRNSARMSICLQVPNLAEVIRELSAINYPVGNIITASHGQELYVYDPDGNRLIFYEPRQDIP